MKTRTIRQSVVIKASAHDVFEILMDEKKHAAFTGGKAKISRAVGGKYSISDGYMRGENLEIVKDKKIVQTWKPEEDCWPDDHYSKITFSLSKVKGGTKLTFVQTGVPVECGKRFDEGWKEFYWEPMKETLERSSRGSQQ